MAKTGQADGTCAPVTPNTDPDNECDGSTVSCNTGVCGSGGRCAPRPNGTPCRSSIGVCDQADVCIAGLCVDNVAVAGTVCRASAGVCDVQEVCTGSSPQCPANVFAPATQVCQPSLGLCDPAETCTGASAACPGNNLALPGTVCNPSRGPCDVAETCTGINPMCPNDVRAPATTVCRASTGVCDAAETCTGTSDACPADALSPPGTVCRASVGGCDVAETCSGTSNACPADVLRGAGFVCRAANGVCDVEDVCDGSSGACPNVVQPTTTVCRAAVGACDVSETCDGTNVGCPTNAFLAANTVCRAAAGACDRAEVCSGNSNACPADDFQSAGTVCRPAQGPCDVQETCGGATAACPADQLRTTASFCGTNNAFRCSGTASACPTTCSMSSQCNEPNQAICNLGACTDTKMVFVTPVPVAGNINGTTGLSGADSFCQVYAGAHGHPGTYRAWLSTTGTGGQGAAARMTQHNLPYIRYTREKIADNFADLIDGSLDLAVLYTSDGVQLPAGAAWTGTLANGTAGASNNCNNWTSNGAAVNGLTGSVNSTSGTWTNNLDQACSSMLRLICVEQ